MTGPYMPQQQPDGGWPVQQQPYPPQQPLPQQPQAQPQPDGWGPPAQPAYAPPQQQAYGAWPGQQPAYGYAPAQPPQPQPVTVRAAAGGLFAAAALVLITLILTQVELNSANNQLNAINDDLSASLSDLDATLGEVDPSLPLQVDPSVPLETAPAPPAPPVLEAPSSPNLLTQPSNILGIVVALATAGVYAWLGVMLFQLRPWARIAATTLLGQALAALVLQLSLPALSGFITALIVVQGIAAVGIVVLLWIPASRSWFPAQSARESAR